LAHDPGLCYAPRPLDAIPFLALRPGIFDDIIEFKVWLATIVLGVAVLQVASMASVYGWLPVPDRIKEPLAIFHRWEGRTIVFVAVIIAVLCILDPGPQSSPDRQRNHTYLGIAILALLTLKIGVIHFAPKAHTAVLPVLGLAVSGVFVGLWYTSSYAFWFEGGSGYTGHATVDALVLIVTDRETVGAYNPPEVNVKKGHAIEWRNDDSAPHTVTAAGFDSGPRGLRTGDTFKWQFNRVGTVEYRCTIHPSMTGTVVVVP
jgi:plastocyanin